MKKFSEIFILGGLGALTGAVIGEFFPKLFNTGFIGGIGNAISKPFSAYRNELALKYALIGLGIGAVIGLVLMLIRKK